MLVPEGGGWEAEERMLERKEEWEVKAGEERVREKVGGRVGLMSGDERAEEEEDKDEEEAVAEFGHLVQEVEVKGGRKKGNEWEKVW